MTERIPVAIITGFLGSGKTTLIAHLLKQNDMSGALVIVNEFGEVGIDHDLLEASSDDTILLANGCLCCTIRGNLVDTLADVVAQREQGRLRDFDRVIVETSGVADPSLLLAFLFSDQKTMARYRVEAVVTTCDALATSDFLQGRREALNQIRVADRTILTKTDLATDAQIAASELMLAELNPAAPIIRAVQGEVSAETILGGEIAARDATRRATGAFICDNVAPDHVHDERCQHGPSGHSARFRSLVLSQARPLRENEPEALLAAIRNHASPELLRLKGALRVEHRDDALVVQAALTIAHELEFRPLAGAAVGRLVLIADGEPSVSLFAALGQFGLAGRV